MGQNVYRTVLGLGSNLGNVYDNLNSAIHHMSSYDIRVIKTSHFYKSKAVLTENAPEEWDITYLNGAALCEVTMQPRELLAAIKEIEKNIGREPAAMWAPRIIDIDILCFENLVVVEPDLCIPHKLLLQRDFAIIPLAEVWPEWVHPHAGESANKISESIISCLTP